MKKLSQYDFASQNLYLTDTVETWHQKLVKAGYAPNRHAVCTLRSKIARDKGISLRAMTNAKQRGAQAVKHHIKANGNGQAIVVKPVVKPRVSKPSTDPFTAALFDGLKKLSDADLAKLAVAHDPALVAKLVREHGNILDLARRALTLAA